MNSLISTCNFEVAFQNRKTGQRNKSYGSHHWWAVRLCDFVHVCSFTNERNRIESNRLVPTSAELEQNDSFVRNFQL